MIISQRWYFFSIPIKILVQQVLYVLIFAIIKYSIILTTCNTLIISI
nr:MAG TPA: hypothetical protein [Crassvirales sp.]